ncbi:MAG TPA: hypothetical protein DEA08_11155 [Planctomycetes bacterium]|nr:hypothetical protein [Planctomycetota bacterium]
MKPLSQPLFLSFALCAALCGCSGGSSGSGGASTSSGSTSAASTGGVTFALTDAPSDDLSALTVEVTGLSVTDDQGVTQQVFPGPGGGRVSANLLRLRGVSKLLSHLSLPPGTYQRLDLDYTGAAAADRVGNALSVSPASGRASSTFSPPLVVTGASQLVEVDFDVDASVTNLVLGAGGSLTLDPTLLLKVERQGAGYAFEDFHGSVAAIQSGQGLDVQLGAGTVRVLVDGATRIAARGSLQTGPAGLGLLQVGDPLEIHGTFDIGAGAVRASAIELDDGLNMSGPEAQGIVLSTNASGFELLVLARRDALFPLGSVQQVAVDAATRYAYDGYPGVSASLSSLRPGQEVRVYGVPGTVSGVKLRETRLEGTVQSVANGRAQVSAQSFERVSVSSQPSLPTQVEVALGGLSLSVGAKVELEGHFGRSAPGVFDLVSGQAGAAQAQQEQIEGTRFQVLGNAPLTLEITGDAGALGNPLTLQVTTSAATVIVERDKQTGLTTPISAADLEAGIQAGRYQELRAKGSVSGGVLQASSLRADLP